MNVLFHITTSFTIAVVCTDKSSYNGNSKVSNRQLTLAFVLSFVSHAILDFIPHCYPINSKLDIIMSSFIIGLVILSLAKPYKLLFTISFFGVLLPDLIDLGPQILNKYLLTNIPIIPKIFPWHWKQFSGSIYASNCTASTYIHGVLIILCCMIFGIYRKRLKQFFRS